MPTIAKIHLSILRAMIGLVLLALLVMGFVVFVFWLQFFASDEVSKAVGIGIARWALTLVVFALLWATGTVLKDPVRLLITGERARGVVVGVARVAGAAQQDSLESPYVTSRRAIDLHVAGLRTMGRVVGLQWTSTRTNDRTLALGDFAMIAYRDTSGEEHIIRRTLAKPVSRLVTGDEVEVLFPARHPARGS